MRSLRITRKLFVAFAVLAGPIAYAATAPSMLAIVPIPAPEGKPATIYAHVSDPDGNMDYAPFYYWDNDTWNLIETVDVPSGVTDTWLSVTWTPPSTQSYNIHVGIYDSGGLNHGDSETTIAEPLPALTGDELVATLPGDLSVDNKGSANYSIPLRMAPGRGNLQPSVALSYSSGSGNGPVGVGWSVSTGFPQAITRGRTILARDGFLDGPDYDSNDKLYLDGKRLISVSGTYGQPDSYYRTEVDSFVHIRAYGSSGNIDYFEATDKNGVVMTFGKLGTATDGYQTGGGEWEGKAFAYALKRVEDTIGNFIEFSYEDFGGGEWELSEIAYTGFDSTPPLAQVDFLYSTDQRVDTNKTYMGLRHFQSTARLETITTSIDVSGVREIVANYLLEYENGPDNGRSRLTSVIPVFAKSDLSGYDEVPPTSISWSDEAMSWGDLTDPTSLPDTPTTAGNYPYVFADFTGDGKDDYLSSDGNLVVYKSTGTGFASASTWFTAANPDFDKVILGDFNGDGMKDVLYGVVSSGNNFLNLYALKSTGSGFVGLNGGGSPTFIVDTTDIFKDPTTGGTFQELRQREGVAVASRIVVADFTGDGRDDVMLHDYFGYFHLYKSTGTGFQFVKKSTYTTAGFTTVPTYDWTLNYTGQMVPANYSVSPMPVDLNGDGLTDYASMVSIRNTTPDVSYLCTRTFEYSIALPDGDFTQPHTVYGQTVTGTAGSSDLDSNNILFWVEPTDVNGDGLTDFLMFANGFALGNRWMLYINKGPNTFNEITFETITGPMPNTITVNSQTIFTHFSTVRSNAWASYNLLYPWQNYGTDLNDLYPSVETSGGEGSSLQDMNGDGFPDYVWYVYENSSGGPANGSNQGWWVMYGTGGLPDSNGDYFGNPEKLSGDIWSESYCIPVYGEHASFDTDQLSRSVDTNGDGLPDWTARHAYRGRPQRLDGIALNNGQHGDLVTAITNGNGRTTAISYLAAKEDAIYTPGVPVNYPIREVRGSNPVVSDVFKDSGLDNGGSTIFSQFSYQYSGNRLDLSGRGGLGFHSFVTLDRQTDVFKYQFLVQSFPMTGLTHREQTYRFWDDSGAPPVNFRLISSHDNTVVFDEVVNSVGGAAYGTVYPFISMAVEKRWEDSTTAHFTYSASQLTAGSSTESAAELLFPETLPTDYHTDITAKSWFDNQTLTSDPPDTIPGDYEASDTNSSGANVVVGIDDFSVFDALTFPRTITHGNLRKLSTDYGSGYSETVETTYFSGVTLNGVYTLTGRPNTVKTTAVAPSPYGTDYAPDKVYTYVTNTPIVASELIDANRNGSFESSGASLDLKTTYTRDARGRVTATEIWGNETVGDYYVGKFDTSKVTSYDDRFDLPLISRNAFDDETHAEYHDLFGVPVSVEDHENGAEVTTEYDALGRAILVTDELKDLETTTEFAWTPSTTSDWKSQQTVQPPGGLAGVVAQYSVYAVHTTATVQPAVTEYFDRLGRTIRTVKEGFAGQRTYADTIYDSLGRVVAVSNPYLEGATKYWTQTTYDPFGRVATVTSPNGTVTENTYVGRVTRVEADAPNKGGVDPAPQVNTTLVDARGATIKVWNPDNVPGTLSIDGSGMTDPSITYELDGFGRMRATILKGQSENITATYDVLGRQLTLDDPDKGAWSYVNNALGQVKKQTDAKNNVTTSTFDRLGRPLKRITTEPSSGPVETAQWFYYDSSPVSGMHHVPLGNKGWNGAPQRETSHTTGAPGYQAPPSTTIHYYDDKGRNHIDLATVDDKWFYTYADYDAYSRVENIHHYWRPALHEAPDDLPYLWHDFGYTYTYDAESYLLNIEDSSDRLWWEADGTNGYDYLDRPVLVRKGDGHWTKQTFDPTDELLVGIDTGEKNGGNVTPVVQDQSFLWDGLGNLTGRDDLLHSLGEDFTYDILNRLVTSQVAGKSARTVAYAANGNITSKNDVAGTTSGTYGYSATKPYAVTSAFGYAMTYDANGNLATKVGNGNTWSTRWAGFDKPRRLAKNNKGSEFVYNAARQRVIHLEFDAMTSNEPSHYTRKKLYALGTDLEVDYLNVASTGEDWRLDTVRIYVPGPGGKIGTMEFEPFAPFQNAEKEYVYHRDHLGSIESITEHGSTSASYALDDTGKPSRYSYDPWGERRDPIDWDGAPTTATTNGGNDDLTPRGFTGHEMLDELGLVHMGGRIYDGQLGRFLSADIIVQFPDRLQSFNRYSYVRNNPLTYTDPSGYAEDDNKVADPEKEKKKNEKEKHEISSTRRALERDGLTVADLITGGAGEAASENVTSAVNEAQPTQGTVTDNLERESVVSANSGEVRQENPIQELASTDESSTAPKQIFIGIGVELPIDEATGPDGLNTGIDTGHTFSYAIDAEGNIVGLVSFGPGERIGPTNGKSFRDGNLPGRADWPLHGDAHVKEWSVTEEQFNQYVSDATEVISNPPNYSPTSQCTSVACGLVAGAGVPVPDGVGRVFYNKYFQNYENNVPNPYHLFQQLEAPVKVSTDRFK